MAWYTHASLIDASDRTVADTKEVFSICNISCAGLAGSLFSKCHPALLREQLKAIPPEFEIQESSVIDLSLGADRHAIKKHLSSIKAMGACYVCSGKARGNVNLIVAAKQTTKLQHYRKY